MISPMNTDSRLTSIAGCDFCSIAQGKDRSTEIIGEDDHWVAFFPLDPATRGHTLVIPRAHFPDLWAIEPWLGAELMAAVIRIGRAIETALDPDGMNLITSSGRAAEQTVDHLHLHVVPRWSGDGFGRIWPPERSMDEAVKEGIAERIRKAYSQS